MSGTEILAAIRAAGCRVKYSDKGEIEIRPREKVTADLAARIRAERAAVVAALIAEQAPPEAPAFPFGQIACWDHIAGEWCTWDAWVYRCAVRARTEWEERERARRARERRQAEERAALEPAAAPRQERLSA